MDPKTLQPFRTLYRSLKGALMVPFKGTRRAPYFRKLPHQLVTGKRRSEDLCAAQLQVNIILKVGDPYIVPQIVGSQIRYP